MVAALIVGLSTELFQKKNTNSNNVFASLGGEFQLMSQNGLVSLSDFKDKKLVLMFFGYTHCPDVCPISLSNVARGLKGLSKDAASQVQVIMISLDPERDTPSVLAEYVAFFDTSFLGLTGLKEQIDQVVKKYGAVYRVVDLPDSEMKYGVDHSSRLYLINKSGELEKMLYHDSKSEEITQAIVSMLNQ